jgi:hypothetical protein
VVGNDYCSLYLHLSFPVLAAKHNTSLFFHLPCELFFIALIFIVISFFFFPILAGQGCFSSAYVFFTATIASLRKTICSTFLERVTCFITTLSYSDRASITNKYNIFKQASNKKNKIASR